MCLDMPFAKGSTLLSDGHTTSQSSEHPDEGVGLHHPRLVFRDDLRAGHAAGLRDGCEWQNGAQQDGAGATTCPCEPGEAIISGFLSPLERAVFKDGLDHKKPLIWVKPWGLEDDMLAAPVRLAIAEGRLLVVSPFPDDIEAPSLRRAAWCNQYVLAHCDRLIVGHLNPGGMLSCILSEADPELEITYL